MSQHFINPEIEKQLAQAARKSTITSLIVALLIMLLIFLLLAYILIPALRVESPVIVVYQSADQSEVDPQVKKVRAQVQRKPSAPSSSATRVIVSANASPTAIPTIDFEVEEPTVEFGDDSDYGAGWGDGSGWGGGGGGASFFGQKVSAERIAYVIDFSASMRGERERLMRKELKKSLSGVASNTQIQLICFAGPAWVGGGTVKSDRGKKKYQIISEDKKSYDWKNPSGKSNDFEQSGKRETPEWRQAEKNTVEKLKNVVSQQELIFGTQWENALEMAFSMKPKPQIIYFMTDGLSGRDSEKVEKKYGARAKREGIIINCVALMEPKAKDAMMELAKASDGQFTMVEKGGKVEVIKVK